MSLINFRNKVREFLRTKFIPGWVVLARDPDVTIYREAGRVYLRRWWILPRNKYLNVYLHEFNDSDDDRALHNHPWNWVSIILKGYYWEHLENGVFFRLQGSARRGSAGSFHRVELVNGPDGPRKVWTLFITTKRIQDWGFMCPGGRFVPWKQFVKKIPGGNEIGKGCGE